MKKNCRCAALASTRILCPKSKYTSRGQGKDCISTWKGIRRRYNSLLHRCYRQIPYFQLEYDCCFFWFNPTPIKSSAVHFELSALPSHLFALTDLSGIVGFGHEYRNPFLKTALSAGLGEDFDSGVESPLQLRHLSILDG